MSSIDQPKNEFSADSCDRLSNEINFTDSERLLSDYSQDDISSTQSKRLHRRSSTIRFTLTTVLSLTLNISLLAIGAILYHRRGPSNSIFPQALYSPAQDILSYEVVKFNTAFGKGKSEYQGDPSPELDSLWEDLFLLLVHPDMPDRFAVGLSVFHDLHCLNTVRRGLDYFNFQMWNSTHNPLNTPLHLLDEDHRIGGPLDPPHLSHCIDHLRQAIQCHADISTVVWQWSEASQNNKIYGSTVRTCRNFDAVRRWATEHDYSKVIYSPEKPEELGLCGAYDQGCGN
ncbi:hypothetical protein G7054_g8010 [Neopestalotiopsis clavispora]|nr:hypothetical protein G7054_g8010 [Neopestalotiopsis clavispora]